MSGCGDYLEGTACRRLCFQGHAHTDIQRRNLSPSSSRLERCADAGGRVRLQSAPRPAAHRRMPCTARSTWAQPRDRRLLAPAPDCLLASRGSRPPRGLRYTRKAPADLRGRYLPPPCGPIGAQHKADLRPLPASAPANTARHQDHYYELICGARR